jgi:hypothetical protein
VGLTIVLSLRTGFVELAGLTPRTGGMAIPDISLPGLFKKTPQGI